MKDLTTKIIVIIFGSGVLLFLLFKFQQTSETSKIQENTIVTANRRLKILEPQEDEIRLIELKTKLTPLRVLKKQSGSAEPEAFIVSWGRIYTKRVKTLNVSKNGAIIHRIRLKEAQSWLEFTPEGDGEYGFQVVDQDGEAISTKETISYRPEAPPAKPIIKSLDVDLWVLQQTQDRSPANKKEAITLRWERSSNSHLYEVMISPSKDFEREVKIFRTKKDSKKISLEDIGPFFWKVRGINSFGVPGEFSQTARVNVRKWNPTIHLLKQHAKLQAKIDSYLFEWNIAPQVYDDVVFQLATDPEFRNLKLNQSLKGNQYQADISEGDQTLYWRISISHKGRIKHSPLGVIEREAHLRVEQSKTEQVNKPRSEVALLSGPLTSIAKATGDGKKRFYNSNSNQTALAKGFYFRRRFKFGELEFLYLHRQIDFVSDNQGLRANKVQNDFLQLDFSSLVADHFGMQVIRSDANTFRNKGGIYEKHTSTQFGPSYTTSSKNYLQDLTTRGSISALSSTDLTSFTINSRLQNEFDLARNFTFKLDGLLGYQNLDVKTKGNVEGWHGAILVGIGWQM